MQKEFALEWRNKYALSSSFLYVGATVYTVLISYGLRTGGISQETWNALFWIILLFSAVNAITKSFTQESKNRNIYYYTLVSPQGIIFSKILHNFVVMMLISLLSWVVFTLFIGDQVANGWLFLFTLFLGALSFSTSLTLVSGIASGSGNSATMLTVLGLPVVIPVMLLLIKISKHAIVGLEPSLITDELINLLAINVIVVVLSYLLFPYLWKS